MCQIVQVIVVGKDAADDQDGLMVSVGGRIFGHSTQITGFVNVTNLDQVVL